MTKKLVEVGLAALRLSLQLMLVLLLIWGLLAASPLDPLNVYLGGNRFGVSAEQQTVLMQQLGLNLSAGERLCDWLAAASQGYLGYSALFHQDVSQVIAERLPLSVLLMSLAWLGSLVLGYLLGLVAALKQGSVFDVCIRRAAWALSAIPPFWLGMLFISLFAVGLHWLPVCCAAPPGMSFSEQPLSGQLAHLILPVLTLTLVHMSPVILHTREKVLDVLASDYVAYARMHGDNQARVVSFHVIPNSLVPAVVLQLASFAELFGGSVLAETLFSFPGIGQALVTAAMAQDTALLMAGTLISALLVFTGNAAANLIAERLLAGEEG
ncbi:ABC transporter permease [Shewanella submarina]|uniref:ABC transporter permease n=1 Tax=Shewanella submarina TaxID=2016376 RepID=A0ABV7GD70_9GAMM|nr:ABC transporter permease [Shewanella submarina]MCL1039206.1 ABC transporter permease [Shewanella submarina]